MKTEEASKFCAGATIGVLELESIHHASEIATTGTPAAFLAKSDGTSGGEIVNTTGTPKFRPLTNELQALGNNIRLYRLRRKITQQELAQMVGYGWPRQIYCIEKGISSPSIIMLARLSKALKVPADKLLEGVE